MPSNDYFGWGNEKCEYLFMLHDYYKSRIGGELDIRRDKPMTYILHGDAECVKMEHGADGRFKGFNMLIDVPEEHLIEHKAPTKSFDYSILYDNEIIMGGMKRLNQVVMDKSRNNPDHDIMVSCACTPAIIGDDVNLARSNSCPIYCKGIASNDFLKTMAEDILLKMQKRQPQKNLINLTGFPQKNALKEIVPYLELLGISINRIILPKISDADLSEYTKASTQVLFPGYRYERVYDRIFRSLTMGCISPPPPYGFKGTTRWTGDICRHLGISPNERWKSKVASLHKQFIALQKEAERYTIGLVLSGDDIEKMMDSNKFFDSIPLLMLLQEMGFTLDIMIHADDFAYARARLTSLLEPQHSIKRLKNEEEFKAWIAKESIDAIYSDFTFDERLTKNGKNRISLAAYFEIGYEGAIRTLERLLEICSHGFIKKYHGHFAEAIT